jgi:chemotaxis response regulator CheB
MGRKHGAKIRRMPRRPRTRTVLVVEDDETLRRMYSTALRAAGYEVLSVGDGMETLQVLEQHLPAQWCWIWQKPFLPERLVHVVNVCIRKASPPAGA